MNDRQRFIATMHYGERDRCPIYDFNFWNETLPEWHKQGLPEDVNRASAAAFFGMDWSMGSGGNDPHYTGINARLCPEFEFKVVEDRGDHEVVQQSDGVRVLRKKYMSSIPHPERHLLVDRTSWAEHYRPRLDPDHPKRWPEDWDARVAHWTNPERSVPISLPGGSLYGQIRDWMGIEAVSYVVYDDPAWFEEMVETVADCAYGALERILKTGASFEACLFWEDMCYSAGPLLSPEHFKRFLVPHYKRITGLLRKHGVDVVWVDCDGKVDELIGLWLEGGVNCMFPIEVGTWGGDPVKLRKEYGKELLMMGGFGKRILAGSERGIRAEVERLAPLVEEGGFIPLPDHRVPPDVPFDHYVYYLSEARRVWGKGVNLPAMPAELYLKNGANGS